MKQLASKKITFLLLAVVFILLPQICFLHKYTHPTGDDEFVSSFPGWIDVKKEFKLKGNGNADETLALQDALNSIGNGNSSASVLNPLINSTKIITLLHSTRVSKRCPPPLLNTIWFSLSQPVLQTPFL
jgi:hypothetical protein